MATGVAAMLWSRITVLNSAENLVETNPLPLNLTQRQDDKGKDISFEQIGMIYPVADEVTYVRQTLLNSVWQYSVLAVQPLLTIIMFGAILFFHSTPVDRGFGLISILSGIDAGGLNSLAGAALSGKLTKEVKLVISPSHEGDEGAIKYHIALPSSVLRNAKLARDVTYH
ncbi:hypothetical protein H2198_005651 [Neophaeococcomyces mojaviensis]|uniref:Uncharacterized protein n=1 Tax=Neophaeococcomyces mojaviensis TaxID=3383035 RepID=A0ACC3A4Y4_9EURO|nr:hypothetical protein H2198_005651 [Knufia sp. JES_112]